MQVLLCREFTVGVTLGHYLVFPVSTGEVSKLLPMTYIPTVCLGWATYRGGAPPTISQREDLL